MKKLALLLAIIMAALCVLTACGSGDPGSGDGGSGSAAVNIPADVKAGDKLTFGSWDTDGTVQPLSWTVITTDVGKALLFCDSVIERMAYNDSEENKLASWEKSDIRAYLRGEFCDTAFSDGEKEVIAPTELKTGLYDSDNYNQFKYGTTEDTVFLLSFEEIQHYVMKITDLSYGIPTKRVADSGIYLSDVSDSATVKQAAEYFLRDDSIDNPRSASVVTGYDGKAYIFGSDKDTKKGVRPAVWVYTDKELAEQYAAGKASAPADKELDAAIAALKVGDTFNFGEFWYGIVGSNIYPFEDIEWRVLDEDDSSFLLLANVPVAYRPFLDDREAKNPTWDRSDLRAFLNDEEYIDSLFTPAQRAKLVKSRVPACDNAEYPAGEDTDDYLFILSAEELEKYFPNEADRAMPYEALTYWTRNHIFADDCMTCINSQGGVYLDDCYYDHSVRIAARIKK